MRPLLLAIALVLQGTPDLPPEQYPGQRQHREPPPGYFCAHDAKDAAHKCACKRMAEMDEHGCCLAPKEDPTCSVYCHADRCTCPITCDVPEGR